MNIRSKLNQTVTYATRSGVDSDGDPSYNSQATIPARVEVRHKIFALPDGTQKQSSHIIYTETRIPLGARIWLPGDTTTNANHARTIITENADPSLRANQTLYQTFV